MIESSDYNLTGGTVAANTAAFQQFLNGAEGDVATLKNGSYTFGAFQIKPGTRLLSQHATVNCDPAHPSNLELMTFGSGVVIDGLSVVGLGPSSARVNPLISPSMSPIEQVVIQNCKFGNTAYIGVAIGGVKKLKFLNNELYGCGKPAVTAEGGPALWIGVAGATNSPSPEALIQGNNIHDCEWAGIYVTADKAQIFDNQIYACKESGIFGNVSLASIRGNTITNISRKYISSCGMELGGTTTLVEGNIISGTGAASISFMDSQGIVITGNHLSNCRLEPAYYTHSCAIDLPSLSATAPNQYISITNNWFTGFSSMGFVGIGGPGAAAGNIVVRDNEAPGMPFGATPGGFTRTASGYTMYQNGKIGSYCSLQ
jgi:parallel beta-helix repeat protein